MARVKEVTKEGNENYQQARERRRIEQLRWVCFYVDVISVFLDPILTHVEKGMNAAIAISPLAPAYINQGPIR